MRKRSLLITYGRSKRFQQSPSGEDEGSAAPNYEALYASYVEGFKAGSKDWALGCCPFHLDNSPSFAMNLENGCFMCRSSNCAVTGTAIDFLIRHEGMTYQEALHHLESFQ